MRFVYSKAKKGDTIRAKAGSIYHYGIYVDDETIIQFGPSPKDPDYLKKENKVLSSDIDTFSCGERIQVGKPNRKETSERFPDEKIVDNAKKRLGEGGYNLIHNNCEHFVYECSFGYKKCSQEDWARKHFKRRTVANVYFKKIENEEIGEVYPESRNKEIDETKRYETKLERYAVWKLLEYALKHSFNKEIKDLKFRKSKNGKWTCGKIKFSLSHSKGYVMVGVSNHRIGVDIEADRNYSEDRKNKIKNRVFLDDELDLDFYEVWTRKESVFKYLDEDRFIPQNIDTGLYPCVSGRLEDYTYSVCGKIDHLHLYVLKGEELVRL